MQSKLSRLFNLIPRWRLLAIYIFTSLGDILLPVYAAPNSGALPADIGQKTFSFGAYFLQAGVSLLLMGIAGFAIILYFRRFGGVNNKKSQFMKIISAYSLNARDKLIIIKIFDECLLLAISPGNIRLLHKFDNGFNPIVDEKKQKDQPQNKYSQFVQHFVDSMEREKRS